MFSTILKSWPGSAIACCNTLEDGKGWRFDHMLINALQESSQDLANIKDEEDGAVDLLMQAGTPAESSTEGIQKNGDQAGQGWTQYLWNVQRTAVSAASAVGNVGQLLPNRIHFGRSMSWAAVRHQTLSIPSCKIIDAEEEEWFPDSRPMPMLLLWQKFQTLATTQLLCHPFSSLFFHTNNKR